MALGAHIHPYSYMYCAPHQDGVLQITPAEASIEQLSHEIAPVHNNEKISINYIHKGKIWDRNTTHIDDAFSF